MMRGFEPRQEAVNWNLASLQTKKRKRLLARFPFRCMLDKIILPTKLLTATDLRFYDFETGVPIVR